MLNSAPSCHEEHFKSVKVQHGPDNGLETLLLNTEGGTWKQGSTAEGQV